MNVRLLSCALVLSIALACIAAGRAPTAQALITVKVRVVAFASYSVFYLARARGLFEKEGLRVEFIDMDATSAVVPALVRGDIDVLPAALSPALLNAIARGGRVRFVATQNLISANGCVYGGILASRGLVGSGALANPAMLRGKRIAANNALAFTYFVDRALQPYGLSSGDLQTIDVPQAVAPEAMRAGRIDLVSTSDPALTRVLDSGEGVLWKSFGAIAPDFQYTLLAFGPSLLDRQPDVGRRFMTAYLRAVREFNLGKTPGNLDIISRETQTERRLLERTCWATVPPSGALNTASILDFQSWALARKLVDRPLSPAQFLDTSFLDYANAQLVRSR